MDYTEQQFADFFVGLVDAIDEDGIYTTHPMTGCKNFYALQYVVGLTEEQVLYRDNPEDAKIIDEYLEASQKQPQPIAIPIKGQEATPKQQSSEFVDLDVMADLAKQVKDMG